MKLPHFTQHGSRKTGDALDLFGDETTLLEDLCNAWEATTPDRSMGDKVVTAKWDHGTVGKLLLEHTAVRLAASEDVARVLSEEGRDIVATLLTDENEAVRPLLDHMYDSARGVQPISVAITPSFVEPADALLGLLRPSLSEPLQRQTMAILTAALGPNATGSVVRSSSANTHRRIRGRPAAGTTQFPSSCVCVLPRTASGDSPGVKAASGTASWHAATIVRSEAAGSPWTRRGRAHPALGLRYLLRTGVLVGAVGLESTGARKSHPRVERERRLPSLSQLGLPTPRPPLRLARTLGLPFDRRALATIRVLGLRHLVQAAVVGERGRRIRFGVLVDLLHGASMLLLAKLDAPTRRAALCRPRVAFGFGAGGLIVGPNNPPQWRAGIHTHLAAPTSEGTSEPCKSSRNANVNLMSAL